MKKQKGEIALALAAVIFAWGAFAALVIPDVYYGKNRAEDCPVDYHETTRSQRQECYVEKDANDIGKTLVDKE